MTKKINTLASVFIAGTILLAFWFGCIYELLDYTNRLMDLMIQDSVQSSQAFDNQGRIPDTTIGGVEYYKAN